MKIRSFVQIGVVAAAALCVLPWSAHAQVSITVGAANVTTDNVALAPEGEEVSENIRVLTTALRYTRAGADSESTDIDLTYRIQSLHFEDNGDADSVYHQLDANATFEIVSDRFFIETTGLHNQMSAAPDQQFQFSNLNLGGDRSDLSLVEIRPYVRYEIGDAAVGLVEYSTRFVSVADFDDVNLQRALLELGSASADVGTTWELEYSREWDDFGVAGGFEFERFEAEVGYWVSTGVRLFVMQGIETDYRTLSGDLDEHYWEGGVQWAPNSRMDLEAAYGKRYFDNDAYRLNITRTTRTGTVYVNYSQEPTTTNLRFFDIIGSIGSILAPDETLVAPGEDSAFVQQRFEAGVQFDSQAGTIDLAVMKEKQIDAITDVGAAVPDASLRGVSLNWTRQVSTRFSLMGALEIADRTRDDAPNGDRLRRAVLGVDRSIGRRTDISAAFVREESDPDAEGTLTSYKNDMFVLRFGMAFGRGEQAGLSRDFL